MQQECQAVGGEKVLTNQLWWAGRRRSQLQHRCRWGCGCCSTDRRLWTDYAAPTPNQIAMMMESALVSIGCDCTKERSTLSANWKQASAWRGSDQSQFAFPLDWKKRRSKQGFGQLEHSEASASYSKASASSSNNERLNNASPCCHELGRRWRGSSQLLHRCRWICGSVGQKHQRDSAGITPDIHCITQYW